MLDSFRLALLIIQQRSGVINLPAEIGESGINTVMEEHPKIGEILSRHEIGCVTCGGGICLVKDVVSIHALGDAAEEQIEQEILEYLESCSTGEK